MHNTEINKIYETYAPLTDQDWRSDLVRSVREPSIRGIAFPSFPSADLQRHLQGNSNEMAIRGALSFRDHCVSVLNANGAPLSKDSILIDFGTGWGRIARAFMRDVPAANIYAVEPFDFIVEARKANIISASSKPTRCHRSRSVTDLRPTSSLGRLFHTLTSTILIGGFPKLPEFSDQVEFAS